MKLATITAALILAAGPLQAQTIFKCTDAKGQPIFQHQPCDGARSGAIAVQPMNTVDGKPAGEALTREEIQRRERRAAVIRKWEQERPTVTRPAAQPCYSELEIRNATLDASSATRSSSDRRAAQRRESQMRACVR